MADKAIEVGRILFALVLLAWFVWAMGIAISWCHGMHFAGRYELSTAEAYIWWMPMGFGLWRVCGLMGRAHQREQLQK